MTLVFEPPRRARKPPTHWADLDAGQRRAAVESLGLPGFRADQLSRHYYVNHTSDPDLMTDLPVARRTEIVAELMPQLLTRVREIACDDGRTRKSLWRLIDGSLVESVLMEYRDRTTMCVSSQAGCGMACPFCATGQSGLTRNLTTAEIVDQVVDGQRHLDTRADPADQPSGRVSNIVFMGMGEPLANYRAVTGAVRRITDPHPNGLGISARSVTVSTVGLVPRIRQLTDEALPLTLALSLHAPDDELRDELVPINTRWKVDEALDAAWGYASATKRRVSIEYALIRDINDQPWRADLLGSKLAAIGDWGWVHVNLIPLNPTPGSKWTASDPGVQDEFVARLRAHRIPTTVRDTRGRDIDGACGQLAAQQ